MPPSPPNPRTEFRIARGQPNRSLVFLGWLLIAMLTPATPTYARTRRRRPHAFPPNPVQATAAAQEAVPAPAVRPLIAPRNCSDTAPYPCARTDKLFQDYKPDPLHLSAIGGVGVPFTNDFGETMMRVTDAMTEAPYVPSLAYDMFRTDSSAERNVWGRYDPSLFNGDGGYRFRAGSSGGVTFVFALDDKTLQLVRLDGSPGRFPHGFTQGFNGYGGLRICNSSAGQSGCTWSYLSPTTVFAVNNVTQISKYDFDDDAAGIQPIYNAAACPSLPRLTGPYSPVLSQSNDDSKFAFYNGGSSQGFPTLAIYYDAGTGNCFWYDTLTGMTGGSGMSPRPVDGGVGLLQPPAAPVVVPSFTGGYLVGPATYCVELTLRTQMNPTLGETSPGGETCVLMPPTHSGSLRIVYPLYSNPQALISPPGSNWCTANVAACQPFNLYIGIGSRNETLQATGIGKGASAYTQTAALVTGRRPPSVDTAGYNIHNEGISRDGQWVRINPQQGFTVFWWEPGTNTVLACASGPCMGHEANGFTRWVSQGASGLGLDLTIQTTDFLDLSVLTDGAPHGYTPQDMHVSWNNDDASDSRPVIAAYYNSTVFRGNGSMNPDLNPAVRIRNPWDQEILGVATDGSGTVWRFGHVRSGQLANPYNKPDFGMQPIGQVSQDGKYFIFNSNWLWRLGTYRKSPKRCPEAGSRCRTDVFLIRLQ